MMLEHRIHNHKSVVYSDLDQLPTSSYLSLPFRMVRVLLTVLFAHFGVEIAH